MMTTAAREDASTATTTTSFVPSSSAIASTSNKNKKNSSVSGLETNFEAYLKDENRSRDDNKIRGGTADRSLLHFLAGSDNHNSNLSGGGINKYGILTNNMLTVLYNMEKGYPFPEDGGVWEWAGSWRVGTSVQCDQQGWEYAEDYLHFIQANHNNNNSINETIESVTGNNVNEAALKKTSLMYDNPGQSIIDEGDDKTPTLKNLILPTPLRKFRRRQWIRQRVLIDYHLACEGTREYLALLCENAKLSFSTSKITDQLVETKRILTETEAKLEQAYESINKQEAFIKTLAEEAIHAINRTDSNDSDDQRDHWTNFINNTQANNNVNNDNIEEANPFSKFKDMIAKSEAVSQISYLHKESVKELGSKLSSESMKDFGSKLSNNEQVKDISLKLTNLVRLASRTGSEDGIKTAETAVVATTANDSEGDKHHNSDANHEEIIFSQDEKELDPSNDPKLHPSSPSSSPQQQQHRQVGSLDRFDWKKIGTPSFMNRMKASTSTIAASSSGIISANSADNAPAVQNQSQAPSSPFTSRFTARLSGAVTSSPFSGVLPVGKSNTANNTTSNSVVVGTSINENKSTILTIDSLNNTTPDIHINDIR